MIDNNFIEVKNTSKQALRIVQGFTYAEDSTFRGLWAIYQRPSQTKLDIYEDWERYFHQIAFSIDQIRVSGNGFNFSIYAMISNNDGTKDLFYITKAYNKVIRDVFQKGADNEA